MFAGVAALEMSKVCVTGMASREGEKVKLAKTIVFGDKPKITEWLNKVEDGMQRTLATLLERSHIFVGHERNRQQV
jgi:hypothetical protein